LKEFKLGAKRTGELDSKTELNGLRLGGRRREEGGGEG